MRKKTVAELREAALPRLASLSSNSDCMIAYANARKAMNAFYRLCGLCERALHVDCDSRLYTLERSEAMDKKVEASRNRVNNYLSEFGCHCVWYGYLPTIEEISKPGSGNAISTYFY